MHELGELDSSTYDRVKLITSARSEINYEFYSNTLYLGTGSRV